MKLPRVIPMLELTRMALVFTAVADSWTTMLLHARRLGQLTDNFWKVWVNPQMMVEMAIISAGLYGFGVSLNDLIDRRRDEHLAAHRPLPSGRIGVRSAHLVCAALIAVALAAGVMYALALGNPMSFLLLVWTAVLITFYDFAGKYLVAPGLLSLGLIRLFHAAIASPRLPLIWHPLLLMNHLTIVSTLAYVWEQKRPPVTRGHRAAIVSCLLVIDALLLALFYIHRAAPGKSFSSIMWITPGLLLPVVAIVGFAVVAAIIIWRSPSYRDVGRQLWLAGLLWLIVYDASFVAAYVSAAWAIVIVCLLPVAYLALKLLAWAGGIAALTRRPEFRRAE